MRNKIWALVRLVIGIGIIYFLYVKFRPEDLSQIFSGRNYFWVIDAILVYFVAIIITTVRLKIMLANNKIYLNFFEVFWSNISGMLFSEITPARLGYVYTAQSVKEKSKARLSKTLSVLISTQVLDFVLRGVVSIIAVIYLLYTFVLDPQVKEILFIALIASLAVAAGLIILVFGKRWQKILKSLPFIKNWKILKGIEVLQDVHKKALGNLTWVIILTILAWLLTASRWIFLSNFFELSLSPMMLIFVQPLIFGLMLIPISLAGLGITEGATVSFLIYLGVNRSEALFFAFLDRLTIYAAELIGLKEFLVGIPGKLLGRKTNNKD